MNLGACTIQIMATADGVAEVTVTKTNHFSHGKRQDMVFYLTESGLRNFLADAEKALEILKVAKQVTKTKDTISREVDEIFAEFKRRKK